MTDGPRNDVKTLNAVGCAQEMSRRMNGFSNFAIIHITSLRWRQAGASGIGRLVGMDMKDRAGRIHAPQRENAHLMRLIEATHG